MNQSNGKSWITPWQFCRDSDWKHFNCRPVWNLYRQSKISRRFFSVIAVLFELDHWTAIYKMRPTMDLTVSVKMVRANRAESSIANLKISQRPIRKMQISDPDKSYVTWIPAGRFRTKHRGQFWLRCGRRIPRCDNSHRLGRFGWPMEQDKLRSGIAFQFTVNTILKIHYLVPLVPLAKHWIQTVPDDCPNINGKTTSEIRVKTLNQTGLFMTSYQGEKRNTTFQTIGAITRATNPPI